MDKFTKEQIDKVVEFVIDEENELSLVNWDTKKMVNLRLGKCAFADITEVTEVKTMEELVTLVHKLANDGYNFPSADFESLVKYL